MSTSYRKPGDFILSKLELISKSGQTLDISSMAVAYSVFMSIFDNTLSGNIQIIDAVSGVECFPILGAENIRLQIRTPGDESAKIDHTFATYKISNRSYDIVSHVNTYTLHLTTKDNFTGSAKIFQSNKRAKTCEILTKIFSETFTTGSAKKLDIDPTKYTNSITFPGTNLWESASILSKMAVSNTYKTSCYFLYEDLTGYKFRCIESMVSGSVGSNRTFFFEPGAPVSTVQDSARANMLVKSVTVLKDFDTLYNSTHGMFSRSVTGFDMLTKKIKKYNYALEDLSTLYKIPVLSSGPGSTMVQVVTDDTSRKKNAWISSKETDEGKYSISNAGNIGPRSSRMLLLDYLRLHVVVPGDLRLAPGTLIELRIPSTIETGSGRPLSDTRLSGKYLICSVHHNFKDNTFDTVLDLAKDSFEKELTFRNTLND